MGLSLVNRVKDMEKSFGFKTDIKWTNAFIITLYQVVAVVWSYHYAFPVKWQTLAFAVLMYVVSGLGVTCGVHRYWTHRAYKANRALQVLLLFFFSCASQSTVRYWVWNHRVHHKFSDTEADPHNANRGFFFSHMGWLMMKKDPEVIRRGKQIDMTDITSDPLLMLHEKYVHIINPLCGLVLPTLASVWLWGEEWKCAVAWQCFIRYVVVFHNEMTVNSLAHAFGYKPYNKEILPAQNEFVAFFTMGEGWHNYHHAFPFDYKAAESSDPFNLSTRFINLFAWLGWAYDLRQATPTMITSMAKRIGDGTPVAAEDPGY